MKIQTSTLALAVAIALAAAVPHAVHAQGARQEITAAGEAGTVIGRVKEAARGVSLSGAIVRINGQEALTDREGRVIARYSPQTEPEAIKADIEKLI